MMLNQKQKVVYLLAPVSSYQTEYTPKSPDSKPLDGVGDEFESKSPDYTPSGECGGSYAVGYSQKDDDRYSSDKYSYDRYSDDGYGGYSGYGYNSKNNTPEKEEFSVKLSSKTSSPVLSPKPVMHSESPEKTSEVPQYEEFASEQSQSQPSKITKETENPVSGYSSPEDDQVQEIGEEMNVDLGNTSVSAQVVQSQQKEMKDLTNEEKEQQRLKTLRKEIKKDGVPRSKETTRQLAEKRHQIEKLKEEMRKLDSDNQRAYNAGVEFVKRQIAAQQQASANVNQARLNLLNKIQYDFISNINQISTQNLNNPPITTLIINMSIRNPNSILHKIINRGFLRICSK